MRRFSIWAIVAFCALTVIWSALWFYARGVVETQVDQVLAGSRNADPAIFCNDRTIGGFPFRLKLACAPAGASVNGGSLAIDLKQLN